jgi:metal-responsive CopG/Arc/MetJ family transcriptional regulator
MRTIIDLPAKQIKSLAKLCKRFGVSRAELIRRAVGDYLKASEEPPEDAFGIWRDREIDSLKYEDKLRSEWDR